MKDRRKGVTRSTACSTRARPPPSTHGWSCFLRRAAQYLNLKRITMASEILIHIFTPPKYNLDIYSVYPACAKPQGNNKNKTHMAAARTEPAFQGQKRPEPSRAIGRPGQRREGAEGILMERDGVATPKQIR